LVPRLWALTSLNSIIAEGVALWGIELFRTAKGHVDQVAPQAGSIPIQLYTILYLVLGRPHQADQAVRPVKSTDIDVEVLRVEHNGHTTPLYFKHGAITTGLVEVGDLRFLVGECIHVSPGSVNR
jgi:hypothetical protein